MDGVHIFSKWGIENLADYAEVVFIPRVFWNWENPTRRSRLGCIREGQFETCNESKQRNRNTKRVSSHAKLPGNWENFVRNDENKDELAQFLGQECVSSDTGDKEVIVFTLLHGVVSSRDGQNTDELQPSMLTRRSRHPGASSCQRRHELRFQVGDDKNSWYRCGWAGYCSFPGFAKH